MKRQVEIFTAGCPFCEPIVKDINTTTCGGCDVTTHNMSEATEGSDAFRKAKAYGVKALPAVAVNGVLLGCCQGGGVSMELLKQAGVGQA